MLPATSVHNTTANASHNALPSCCHAGPYGSPYLTSFTSTPGGEPGLTITPATMAQPTVRRNT